MLLKAKTTHRTSHLLFWYLIVLLSSLQYSKGWPYYPFSLRVNHIHIYIYIYIYIYIHIFIYIYVFIFIYIYIYIYIFIYLYIYWLMKLWIYWFIDFFIYWFIDLLIYLCIFYKQCVFNYIYIHLYIHIYIDIYVYIQMISKPHVRHREGNSIATEFRPLWAAQRSYTNFRLAQFLPSYRIPRGDCSRSSPVPAL